MISMTLSVLFLLILPLIPSSVYFISVIVFLNQLFFVFSDSLLKTSSFSLCTHSPEFFVFINMNSLGVDAYLHVI